MTRRRLLCALLLLAFVAALGCTGRSQTAPVPDRSHEHEQPVVRGTADGEMAGADPAERDLAERDDDGAFGPEDDPAALAWAEETLARMTLPEKVGQLFVIHGYGRAAHTPDADAQAANMALHGYPTLADVVAALHPGGVIYFQWTDNLHSPEQIAALSAGLQQASLTSGSGVPLLIGIDQEHGLVTRLGSPFTQYPGNMAVAAAGDIKAARMAAAHTAAELRAVGINWNFAPVADVNVNPFNPVIGVRSFGSDPERVAQFVAAQVAGYQEGGVAASAKHFPGHGDTDVDSHTGLPVIAHSRDELEQVDLLPFRSAMRMGVDSIMVGHLAVPALDPSGVPATFSRPIVTALLREQLGYDGVIVTDALDMGGAQLPVPAGEAAVAALRAGVDMLLMPPDPPAAIASVLAAVEAGELTEARIDESVRRILLLKWRRHVVAAAESGRLTDPIPQLSVIGNPVNGLIAQLISRHAITVVRNEGNVLPLQSGSVLVTGVPDAAATVAAGLADAGFDARSETVAAAGSVAAVAAEAARADVTVVLTSNVTDSSPQHELVAALLATGQPVIAVAVKSPYDLSLYPNVSAYVATYSDQRQMLDALVEVLSGQFAASGRLPVSLPRLPAGSGDLYPVGHGLP